jgi:hypothetical protein
MLAVAVALTGPVGASAAESKEPTVMTFTAKGTNGYRMLALVTTPPEGFEAEGGGVGLFIERGRTAGATYAVPHATVTKKRIEADLGDLGKIAVTRVPTGRTKVLHEMCLPEGKARVEIDRFEGTVEFHGEEGFTSIDATSVPGGTYSSFCGIPEGGRPAGRQLPGAQLRVDREVGEESSVSLYAAQERPGEKTSISAEVMETRDGMEIHRFVGVRAPAGALTFDRKLRGATVKPPAPFSGFGHFAARPGAGERSSGIWSGDLSVDLPGHAGVRIGGPGFRAVLEHPTL